MHYISYPPQCYVYGNNGKSASFHVPRRQMTSLNKQHSSSFLMLSQWHIISSNRIDGTHWTAAILLNVLSICPSEVEFPMAMSFTTSFFEIKDKKEEYYINCVSKNSTLSSVFFIHFGLLYIRLLIGQMKYTPNWKS